MRVGKRANVVEAKKTRSCVVRLEKVPSPPAKSVRSGVSPRSASQSHSDEKKFKGPLKKRPITQTTQASSSPAATASVHRTPAAKTKEKDKMRGSKGNKSTPAITPVAAASPPPTIAAGRSRRAIKPNPKYASDDMVTPKMIRNVGVSLQKKAVQEKLRKCSSSSSEDFFNKESSDEMDDNGPSEAMMKSFSTHKKQADSDFSEDVKPIETPSRRRGRPRKGPIGTADSTPTATTKTVPIASNSKSSSSQLQLLRKSFAASVRSMESLVGVKRKHDSVGGSSSDNDLESTITRKRFALTKPANVREFKNLNSSDSQLTVRKGSQSQTVNGSKIMNTASPQTATPIRNQLEKRKPIDGTASNSGGVSKVVGRTLAARSQQSALSTKSPNVRALATAKQRSSSPATIPKAPKTVEKATKELSKEAKVEDSPSSTADDFETMPTFTIVNINDIINKKGDVLISKSSKSQKSENVKNDLDSLDAGKVNENKHGRRKNATFDKVEADRSKSPLVTAKKATQKILNHSLGKKLQTNSSAKANASSSPDKPAPRILNSMVAKKMQPVKPLIANLDDSADDESYPLSLDEDEDAATAEDEEDSFTVDKRKQPVNSSYISSKKSAPATKENSLAATNRLPTKQPAQRKLSPEKVVISRQGDKIIKKITCFEMWYVINLPEDRPPKVLRNQLDIPLIKLANLATDIELPTDSWMSKVTLHELSPTMLAKSSFETYTGDLTQYNIAEQDRNRYQPSCVMFRRSVNDRTKSRLPYDRAVIFKNKTFFTNIEGKNVKLVGAPCTISSEEEVEILLQIVDSLTLQSSLVEPTTTVQ